MGREAYRQAIIQRLLPSLRAFNPDLILLSTGFDPASGDVGNTRSGQTGTDPGMDLGPEDFEWVTSEILKIADICCAGRVVSVLEGGYGSYSESRQAQQQKVASTRSKRSAPEEQKPSLDRHVLASAASSHVHRLVDTYGEAKGEHPLLCVPVPTLDN
jgi:acetoin utilization deacetylase AcuC-like enzyme